MRVAVEAVTLKLSRVSFVPGLVLTQHAKRHTPGKTSRTQDRQMSDANGTQEEARFTHESQDYLQNSELGWAQQMMIVYKCCIGPPNDGRI